MCRKVLFLVFSTAFLSLAIAYDFSDPIYNSVLSSEILEALEDEEIDVNVPVNYRARRDVAPPEEDKRCKTRKSGWMCCRDQIEKTETHDKLKEMKKECYQEIRANHDDAEPFDMFSCERLKRIKQDTECAKECIAKKLEFLDENGAFREDFVKDFFRNNYTEAEWAREKSDSVVTKCLAEANKEKSSEDRKCSSKPIKFYYCMWKEFSTLCPQDKKRDSRMCNRLYKGEFFLPKNPDEADDMN
uniref:Odorant-binding protein n=1 Tax=Phlebotomus papatasi TaxID=29031 RepID=A0A1B0GPA7_PHLPP